MSEDRFPNSARARKRRRRFLFAAQFGLCCLRRSDNCTQRLGCMQLDRPHAADYATFEHLIPRGHEHARSTRFVLLACRRCNQLKSHQLCDDRDLLDFAEALWVEWRDGTSARVKAVRMKYVRQRDEKGVAP